MCRCWRFPSCPAPSSSATTSARSWPICASRGSIEQDADVVMFIFREQYYHERNEPKQRDDETAEKFAARHSNWLERGDRVHNVAEVNIAKQRHGPIGTVELYFEGVVTKFGNLTRDDLPAQS